VTVGDEAVHAAAIDNSVMPGTASDRSERKRDCEAMVAAVLEEALPDEVTDRLSAADAWHIAQELIREVFEPNGFLRGRAKTEASVLAELVGAATLPCVVENRRENVAHILVEILDYAKFIGFEPEAAAAGDWPRLSARALRGKRVA
jgi:hypothetical protein